MASGVNYLDYHAESIFKDDSPETPYLTHVNAINRHIIQSAENGGGITVYPIVSQQDFGKSVLDGDFSLKKMPSTIAHGPAQLEFVPPIIDVTLVGASELRIFHTGAQILYPSGLAAYKPDGSIKLGPRYYAYFPEQGERKKCRVEGTIITMTVKMDAENTCFKVIDVVTLKDDVAVTATYVEVPSASGQIGGFHLYSAQIAYPAKRLWENIAPLDRSFVTERMLTGKKMNQVAIEEPSRKVDAILNIETGGFTVTTSVKEDRNTISNEKKIFHAILPGKRGKRDIAIPKFIPQYTVPFALGDLESTLMDDEKILELLVQRDDSDGIMTTQASIRTI